MSKTNYRVNRVTKEYIVLEDLGPWNRYMTITNAAEDVVAEMLARLNGRRLYYYDSEGELTQLLITNGKFTGFAPVLKGLD
jgi:hypothetical protein